MIFKKVAAEVLSRCCEIFRNQYLGATLVGTIEEPKTTEKLFTLSVNITIGLGEALWKRKKTGGILKIEELFVGSVGVYTYLFVARSELLYYWVE